MKNAKRKGWYARQPLDGKKQFKRIYTVNRDGSVIDNVFLNVSDVRSREEIIAIHFLNFAFDLIFPGDEIVSKSGRDAPWDFSFKLRSGGSFNIEIVSISDNAHRFEVHKREELVEGLCTARSIPLSLLQKINKGIPTENARSIISEAARLSTKRNDLVSNPWYNPTGENRHVYESMLYQPDASLGDLVRNAVRIKEEKAHPDKSDTILIIDNRTQAFDIDDYREMVSNPLWDLSQTPFKQIWFYTGYYSDVTGAEAEFSWSVLHADASLEVRLEIALRGKTEDEQGVILFDM